MKSALVVLLLLVSGCSGWFHAKPPPPQPPPRIMVTGAPAGSVLFLDGVQARPENAPGGRPQIVPSTAGSHTLEVRTGDAVVYRESFDLLPGERRAITVLSGSTRD